MGAPEERKEASRTNGHNHITCSDVCTCPTAPPNGEAAAQAQCFQEEQATVSWCFDLLPSISETVQPPALAPHQERGWISPLSNLCLGNRDKIKTQMEFFYEVIQHKSPVAHISLNISVLKRSTSTT